MAARSINLADPDFEPTDEELIELSKRAFAHVPAQSAKRRAQLEADVAAAREKVRGRLVGTLDELVVVADAEVQRGE